MLEQKEIYEWRTGRHCVFKVFYHLIFVTKYRRGVFTQPMLDRINEVIGETMLQMGGELVEFGGEDDHVHLMVSVPPKLALSNLVGKIKGKSSYFLRKEYWPELSKKFWGNHLWSHSYCVVTCGGAPLDIVKEYVANQRKPPTAKGVKKSKIERGKSRPRKKIGT